MRDRVEVLRQISVDDIGIAPAEETRARAVIAVGLAVKPVGKPDAGNRAP